MECPLCPPSGRVNPDVQLNGQPWPRIPNWYTRAWSGPTAVHQSFEQCVKLQAFLSIQYFKQTPSISTVRGARCRCILNRGRLAGIGHTGHQFARRSHLFLGMCELFTQNLDLTLRRLILRIHLCGLFFRLEFHAGGLGRHLCSVCFAHRRATVFDLRRDDSSSWMRVCNCVNIDLSTTVLLYCSAIF